MEIRRLRVSPASCLLLCRRWAEARQEYDGGGEESKDGGESGDCMMRLFIYPNFHISGVNSQSAKTHRSCHCLIIQTWCIYSFPTKESGLLCIINHQVWRTDSRRDEIYTAQHLFKQLSLLHGPILVSWLICGKFPRNTNIIFKFCGKQSSTVSELKLTVAQTQ